MCKKTVHPSSYFSWDTQGVEFSKCYHEIDFVERFCKVQIDHINTVTIFHEFQNVVMMCNKLAETGTTMPEAMLAWVKQVMS